MLNERKEYRNHIIDVLYIYIFPFLWCCTCIWNKIKTHKKIYTLENNVFPHPNLILQTNFAKKKDVFKERNNNKKKRIIFHQATTRISILWLKWHDFIRKTVLKKPEKKKLKPHRSWFEIWRVLLLFSSLCICHRRLHSTSDGKLWMKKQREENFN